MSNDTKRCMTWVEVSASALQQNIKTLRKIIGPKAIMAASVKANAYGHGLVPASKILLEAGADWLSVHSLQEARSLRQAKIKTPIYIMGYVMKRDLAEAVSLGCRLVVYNKETVRELARHAKRLKKNAQIHLKVETGNNRQGIGVSQLLDFARYAQNFSHIKIEGLCTHFANIEEQAEGKNLPPYAKQQLDTFHAAAQMLKKNGIKISLLHAANSAASILFPQTHFDMVRPGIAAYGMWPSPEVHKAAVRVRPGRTLKPALAWKTRISQIKEIAQGAYIGYGCTYRTTQKTRLAILPVGYYDGYDRGFSNKAYVLIHGKKAPVRGRICMNIFMVDITNIPKAHVEDAVTLLGKNGSKEISAEFLGELIGTINYEITTRIHENIPRVITT